MALDLPAQFGTYRVVGHLGRGAMGVVYRAMDSREREVALKVILPDVAGDEEVRARFVRECHAVLGLQHRNIISVFDCGVHDDSPYIAMELLNGASLGTRMANSVPMSLDAKLDIVIQLCEGLQFAHEHGVVHRDVKPANIWLLENGGVKILDFGLAKIAGSTFTRIGDLVGSAAYMSPEQLVGGQVDGRSDIFAAGGILYELLSGRHPFEADNVTGTVNKILHESAPPLRSFVPDLREDVERAVEKALQKDVNARFDQAADFGAELRLARYGIDRQSMDTIVTRRPGVPSAAPDLPTVVVATPPRPTQGANAARPTPVVRPSSGQTPLLSAEPRTIRQRIAPWTALIDRMPPIVRQAVPWVALVAVLVGVLTFISRTGSQPAPPTYQLAVATMPPGASIAFDGVESGKQTPATVTLTQRPARIRLTLRGFEAIDSPVPTGSRSEPEDLRYTLKRMLRVESDPAGARILFDGSDTGFVTPADVPVPARIPASVELRLGERIRLNTPMTPAILEHGAMRVVLTGGKPGPKPLGPPVGSQSRVPATVLVSVHVTGGYPFEVSGCGTSSAASERHDLEVRAPCSLRLRAPAYFLDASRRIDASDGQVEIAAPQLARVQLRSRYEWCTVILGGHAVGAPPIDLELVAGTYMAIIQCPDKTYSTRAVPIEPGRSIRRLDEFLR